MVTHVPSSAGGEEGIAVCIVAPAKPRYAAGAPVAIAVAGGHSAGNARSRMNVAGCGFIEVSFAFPGGGQGDASSGGMYDYRGSNCIEALRDVILFAVGKATDKQGRSIHELVGDVTVLTDNVGLFGGSHGGNACGAAMGLWGERFANLAWYVSMESPYGEGAVGAELGSRNQRLNPAYDPRTGVLDLSKLAYDPNVEVRPFGGRRSRGPSSSGLRGGLFFDMDGDGKCASEDDYPLQPLIFDLGQGQKVWYSVRLQTEAEKRGLFGEKRPPHLPTLEENVEFWRYRDATGLVPEAVRKIPGLSVIVLANETDHVQIAPDHPHIYAQVNAFAKAGAFVRLNPDRAYVEWLTGGQAPDVPDNDAGLQYTPKTVGTALCPDGLVAKPLFSPAAMCELADRTQAGNREPNLSRVLFPDAPKVSGPPGTGERRPFARPEGAQRPNEQRPERPDQMLRRGPAPKAVMDRYDRDGDNRLNSAEQEALRRDILEGRLPVPPEVRERFRHSGPPPRAATGPEQPQQPMRETPATRPERQTKRIDVDCDKVVGVIRSLLGVNRGPLSFPHRPGERLTSYVESYRKLGIDFVRTHDFYGPTDWYVIFPQWSADEQEPASYDFRSSDERIRPIVENGFGCFFRLGTSWKGRQRRPINDPPGTVRDDDGRVAHSADREDARKWARICVQTMRHYTQGWNDGYRFPIEYWEIWNEPDLAREFWSGTPEQYYVLYEEAAKALKAANPKLKVGGPACTGGFHQPYVEGFVRYCREHQVPLDFFSWHSYGGREEFNPHNYYRDAKRIRQLLDNNGFEKTENINTEWNAGIQRQYFGDTAAGAAFYASALACFLDAGVDYAFQYCGDRHPGLGLHAFHGSQLKICAYSLLAWKRLLETPVRLAATGSDEQGYNIVAGKDTEGQRVHVLISDFQSDHDGFRLRIANLPWGDSTPFAVKRSLLDAGHRLEVVEEKAATGREITLVTPFQAESVCLLELERRQAP